MPKLKTAYICSECGYQTSKWIGRCTSCGSYNTMNEEVINKSTEISGAGQIHNFTNTKAVMLNEIELIQESRVPSHILELDTVLNGGFVKGSMTLVGGEPGIGKSTLLLQICDNIGNSDNKILYVSGEESNSQIKMRADRLHVTTKNLYLLPEIRMETVEQAISEIKPDFLIIDSIQTVQLDSIQSAPGSMTQVRECTSMIMRISKIKGITSIIIGHVTKEGTIAGPRTLEHMVDTVLYFEGERRASYRIIRVVKNRFGATDEIGVFEMVENGLKGIANPSEYMLSGRPLNTPGSCVTCGIEGTRPILTEVQSLTTYTTFNMPRRVAAGMDFNRTVMLIAVLEKHAGMQFSQYDIYFNIAGGMKITEPSIDAAIIAACASSYRNSPIDPYTVIFGEVGLAGELRAVGFSDQRLAEASKMGFKQCIIPHGNMKGLKRSDLNLRIFGVENIWEMLELLK